MRADLVWARVKLCNSNRIGLVPFFYVYDVDTAQTQSGSGAWRDQGRKHYTTDIKAQPDPGLVCTTLLLFLFF